MKNTGDERSEQVQLIGTSMRIFLFNKPFGVLPQFTSADGRPTLANYLALPRFYPAGRLDFDSEGLMVLTDFGPWQARISQPGSGLAKRYLVQVEGEPQDENLEPLRHGLPLRDGTTRPARASIVPSPDWLWEREPPIRARKSIPAAWLDVEIGEGRNRQVRRMTAAIGFPTLRLIRWSVGPWTLAGLAPGQSREIPLAEAERVLAPVRPRPPARSVRSNVRTSRSASRARGPARN